MRHVLPALAVVLVLMLAPFIPEPVGPSEALALDEPAFADGGCIVVGNDGGSTVTVDIAYTISWNASVFPLIGSANVCVRFCEYDTCAASRTVCPGGELVAGRTYDIAVPANRRFFSATSFDAGTDIRVCIGRVTP